MPRSNTSGRTPRRQGSPGRPGRSRNPATAPARPRVRAARKPATTPEWEPAEDSRDPSPEFDMAPLPGAAGSDDAEARRRIEQLREERQLRQALSDGFDL